MTLEEKIEFLEDLGIDTAEMSPRQIWEWYCMAIGMKLTKEKVKASLEKSNIIIPGAIDALETPD